MAGEAREGGSAADMTRSADYRRGYMDALEDVADTYRVAIVALPTSRWLRRSPDALTVCLRLYEAVREVRRRAARKPKPGRNA